ncbi:MAG: hypothetical protein PHZ19_10425, partial [Candidatus Thermoplasmatota archaeon]|nr:hypothetical protein [Candidatus Thermoplasmatota archaeon]
MTNIVARKTVVIGMMLMMMLSFFISLPSSVSGLGYGTPNDPIWPEFQWDPTDPTDSRAGGHMGAYGPMADGWLPNDTVYHSYSKWHGVDYTATNYRVQKWHDTDNGVWGYGRSFFVFDTRFLKENSNVLSAKVALKGVGKYSNDTYSTHQQYVGDVDIYVFALPECWPGYPNGKICPDHTYPEFDSLFASENYIGTRSDTNAGLYDFT